NVVLPDSEIYPCLRYFRSPRALKGTAEEQKTPRIHFESYLKYSRFSQCVQKVLKLRSTIGLDDSQPNFHELQASYKHVVKC
ncbi:hypothetical protein B0H10DRAFT_2152914, partial [Mycena sp. CBHHK59/15]